MGVFCCCVQHIRLRRRVPQLDNVLKLLTENSEKSINKTNMLEDKLKKVLSRISTLPDINYLNGCFDEMEKFHRQALTLWRKRLQCLSDQLQIRRKRRQCMSDLCHMSTCYDQAAIHLVCIPYLTIFR